MNQTALMFAGCIALCGTAFAAGKDDPLLFKVMIDKLEWRDGDGGDLWVWDADAWIGKDLDKLWFKTEGEYANSTTEGAYLETLYSRAIAPYWDFQAGWPGRSSKWTHLCSKNLTQEMRTCA